MSMQLLEIDSLADQKLSVHDLISIHPLTLSDIQLIFSMARAMKQVPAQYAEGLKGKALALIFEKPSLRTRVTFDVGMTSMGGSAIFLDHSDAKLGERESVRDVA
jgi:ornithine carbamoyltransferase